MLTLQRLDRPSQHVCFVTFDVDLDGGHISDVEGVQGRHGNADLPLLVLPMGLRIKSASRRDQRVAALGDEESSLPGPVRDRNLVDNGAAPQ